MTNAAHAAPSSLWESLLVRHGSPTLAGLKTASLFTLPLQADADLNADLRRWNTLLGKKGLRVVCLRRQKGRALIYLFRPGRLDRDLRRAEAGRLLRQQGYGCRSCGQCVCRLMQRLAGEEAFPHEIGLFLGYPPEDVEGFIANRAENCKCVGMWKVYGDEQAARRLFDSYRACTHDLCRRHREGASVETLAVAA